MPDQKGDEVTATCRHRVVTNEEIFRTRERFLAAVLTTITMALRLPIELPQRLDQTRELVRRSMSLGFEVLEFDPEKFDIHATKSTNDMIDFLEGELKKAFDRNWASALEMVDRLTTAGVCYTGMLLAEYAAEPESKKMFEIVVGGRENFDNIAILVCSLRTRFIDQYRSIARSPVFVIEQEIKSYVEELFSRVVEKNPF